MNLGKKKGVSNMEDKIFTAGEIAKLCGVSNRTIRFYDIKGLLKPVKYSENGYRYYDKNSVEKLQRILMFKYLGFSLEEISSIFEKEQEEQSISAKQYRNNILKDQKENLIYKKDHITKLINAVDVAMNCNDTDEWDSMIKIINILSEDDKRVEQYRSEDNLQSRINIHSYSTSPIGWMQWMFNNMEFAENMKILDIGCGNGFFWTSNIENMPNNLHVIMCDYSFGMLEAAQEALKKCEAVIKEKNIVFEFVQADANDLNINDTKFDVIMANHMIYHVVNRKGLISKVSEILKDDGVFYCSTVGKNHMKELDELILKYDKNIDLSLCNVAKSFGLENGEEQLKESFSVVDRKIHDNNLIVDNAQVIYNYAHSMLGSVPEVLEKSGDRFKDIIDEIIDRDGAMFIQKSTGMFTCKKH